MVGRPAACPSCRGAIKSARKAGLLSLLFPGLGDLHLGLLLPAAFLVLFIHVPDALAVGSSGSRGPG